MSFLFRAFVGSSEPSQQETEDIIFRKVETVCDRLATSQIQSDRIDALNDLKQLVPLNRLATGTRGMIILLILLEDNYKSDYEFSRLCMEILFLILKPDYSKTMFDDESLRLNSEENLSGPFAEIFLKETKYLEILYDILLVSDMELKWSSIRLLIILSRLQLTRMQELLPNVHSAIRTLISLLSCSNELLRNDILLFLTYVTEKNRHIQNLAVYEGILDKLFVLIEEEDYSFGNIIVQDCLTIIENLLTCNHKNQVSFVEENFIHKLVPFFEVSSREVDSEAPFFWTKPIMTNVASAFRILQILCDKNSLMNLQKVQIEINRTGTFGLVLKLLVMKDVPDEILAIVLNAVGDIIHSNEENQIKFDNYELDVTDSPRKLIPYIHVSMISSVTTSSVRAGCSYALNSFIINNIKFAAFLENFGSETAEEIEQTYDLRKFLCAGVVSRNVLVLWCTCSYVLNLVVEYNCFATYLMELSFKTESVGKIYSFYDYIIHLILNDEREEVKNGCLSVLICSIDVSPELLCSVLNNNELYTMVIHAIGGENDNELTTGLLTMLYCTCLLSSVKFFNLKGSQFKFSVEQQCEFMSHNTNRNRILNQLYVITKHEGIIRAAKMRRLWQDRIDISLLFDHKFAEFSLRIEMEFCSFTQKDKVSKSTLDRKEEITTKQRLNDMIEIVKRKNEEILNLQRNFEKLEKEKSIYLQQIVYLETALENLKNTQLNSAVSHNVEQYQAANIEGNEQYLMTVDEGKQTDLQSFNNTYYQSGMVPLQPYAYGYNMNNYDQSNYYYGTPVSNSDYWKGDNYQENYNDPYYDMYNTSEYPKCEQDQH